MLRTRADYYDIWAPRGGEWSPWVKPVLFAHIIPEIVRQALTNPTPSVFASDPTWLPTLDKETFIVADLPGPLGIDFAEALATRGRRPIPLYNAAPGPSRTDASNLTVATPRSVVFVWPILAALIRATPTIRDARLARDALPTFVLDANRRRGHHATRPGDFDNRSICFPSDFPSANLLLSKSLRRVMLVQETDTTPEPDLLYTLREWNRAGLKVEVQALASGPPSRPLQSDRPALLRWTPPAIRSLARNFRPHWLGGYGGYLPYPSETGSWGGGMG